MNFGKIRPSFMIIGVQKGGTTSLYHYLVQHPSIISPIDKELHYFDTLNPTPLKPYLDYFPNSYFTNKISFEATPRYLYYPGTAKKLFDFNPNMKFIVLLRDPVKRAYSAWNMYNQLAAKNDKILAFKKLQKENPREAFYSEFYKKSLPSFEEWIDVEIHDNFDDNLIEPSIIRRGFYKKQIDEYFKYFNRKNFLFIDSKELRLNTVNCLNETTKFLKISKFEYDNLDLSEKHIRDYEIQLDENIYNKLLSYYQIKNKGLEDLTGLQLDWMKNK